MKRHSDLQPPSPFANNVNRGNFFPVKPGNLIAKSTPMIGAIPSATQLWAKRIAPAKPSRSVTASAGILNSRARATKSAGCVVPYLSEYALATCR